MAQPIDDIIQRLEAASEPSFELEEEIRVAVGAGCEDLGFTEAPPGYMRSIDAALTLVPHGWFWRVGLTSLYQAWAGVNKTHPDHGEEGRNEFFFHREHGQRPDTTPAIALCIVALKARAAAERDR
jgi:hypothetical protein